MLQFSCDWCKRLKKPGESWILGYAAECFGARTHRLELNVVSKWSDSAAQDSFAVHFCSAAHKQKYTKAIFGTTSGALVRSTVRTTGAKKQVAALRTHTVAGVSRQRPDQRIAPATQQSRPLGNPVPIRTQRKQVATAAKPQPRKLRRPEFTAADKLRAHGLGISLEKRRTISIA